MNRSKNKDDRLPEILLAQAGEFISGSMGLYFPKGRRRELERGLRSAAPDFGFEDPEAYTRWLISSTLDKSQIEILAGHLTVGETYFFRDKRTFALLEEKILPELIKLRRTTGKVLRIWSAGCCSGEEPYSLAILLHKIMGDTKDWNISLLATDINPVFLRKASAGIYGEWSFRDTPEWVRERYFTKTKEKRFELHPKIRKRVSFTYHNLAETAYPSLLTNTNALDLILCRNVLMYLTPDHQTYVNGKLGQCLVEGGWLITGPSETTDAPSSGLVNVHFQGATFYKKQETRGLTTGLTIDDWRLSIEKQEPKRLATDSIKSTIVNQQLSMTPRRLAIEKQPSSADFQSSIIDQPSTIQMARTAANQGSLPEALGYCEKAIAADRFNPGHYYLQASILQEQGKLKEATADLKKALYLDQDFIPAHILLGNLTLRQGNRRESSRHFRNALRLLGCRPSEEVIPGAEGLTAGRLREIVRTTVGD
ncbi:MAG: CheR family methyltransferase [Thermodesulfobacteriota bacterium]